MADAYNLHGLTQADLEALGIFERQEISKIDLAAADSKFWSRILAKQSGRIGIRRYSRDFDNVVGNYYLDLKIAKIESSMDIRESNGKNTLRRRTLSWSSNSIEALLGNFTAAEGYGLTIGRYDYQPSAGLDYDEDFEFMFPVNSYYNGFKLAIDNDTLGSRIYYSYKKYDDLEKAFYGTAADYKIDNFIAGFAIGKNRSKAYNDINERTAIGMNLRYGHDRFSLAGEYAVIENSGGLYLKCEKRLYNTLISSEFWRYGNNFYNYNCSGPAASDYISFYPGQAELGFRSAQARETGLALNYAGQYGALGLQFWNQANKQAINSAYNLLLNRRINYWLDASFQTVGKSTGSGGYLWSKLKLMPEIAWLKQLGIKGYFTGKSNLVDNKSYVFVIFIKNLSDNFDISLQTRSYFNGHLTWYISEHLTASSGINIITEINFDEDIRVNLKIEKML